MEKIPVKMVLSALECFPKYELPEGFRFRNYAPGDCDTWVELYSAADSFQSITRELFDSEFGGKDDELVRRMFFMCRGDEVVGTSTAWFDKGADPALGRVHWVAVHPDFQGMGLSKPLLSETLRRLREFGHTSVYLMTSTGRAVAIELYRKFGFIIECEDVAKAED